MQLTEADTGQLVTRARAHLADARREHLSCTEHCRLLQAFRAAAQHGELSELEDGLAEDVISYSDGGGLARAARTPVAGRTRVAQFVAAFALVNGPARDRAQRRSELALAEATRSDGPVTSDDLGLAPSNLSPSNARPSGRGPMR